jgi:TrmH family RNA methyltransferase
MGLSLPKFSNPLSREKLKTLRSLVSTRNRKRKGVCLVEGDRTLEEAGRSGYLAYLVLNERAPAQCNADDVTARFPDVPCFTLEDRFFSELTDVRTGTGILGAARIPPGGDFKDLLDDSGSSVLIFLNRLQDPGNVGGIIRSAWAFGISGVLLSKGTADPFSSKGIRSSAGGVFNVPVYYDTAVRDLEELVAGGFLMFYAEAGGPGRPNSAFPDRSILALGSEAHGFSKGIRELGQPLGVPMVAGVNSLNVVVAGSIILAEMTADSRSQIPDSK